MKRVYLDGDADFKSIFSRMQNSFTVRFGNYFFYRGPESSIASMMNDDSSWTSL